MKISDLLIKLDDIAREHGQGVEVFIELDDPGAEGLQSYLVDEFEVLVGPTSLTDPKRKVVLR